MMRTMFSEIEPKLEAEQQILKKLNHARHVWRQLSRCRPGLKREGEHLVPDLLKANLQEVFDQIVLSIQAVNTQEFSDCEASSALSRFFASEELRLVDKRDGRYFPSPLFQQAGFFTSSASNLLSI